MSDTNTQTTEPAKQRKGGILSRIAAFKRQTSGNVAMMFGLASIPLIGMVGLGLDGSRVLLAKSELQAALDSAALAVGSTSDAGVNLESRLQEFTRTNYRSSGTTAPNVTLPISSGDIIRATASTQLSTYFMGVLNIDTVDITVDTQIQTAVSGLMVSLVLDNTGSMWGGGKIYALKQATHDLTDILFGVEKSGVAPSSRPVGLRVSIVPYAAAVNPGSEVLKGTIIDPKFPFDRGPGHPKGDHTGSGTVFDPNLDTYQKKLSSAALGYERQTWKGCVRERIGPSANAATATYEHAKYKALVDTSAAEDGYWIPFYYENYDDNKYDRTKPNNIRYERRSNRQKNGPNVACPQPITPLTNDYAVLNQAIEKMVAWNRGGTISDTGLAWGIRTLSPGEPFTESAKPSAAGFPSMATDPNWRKAIVIMTDGVNQLFDSGGTKNNPAGTASDDTSYYRLNSPENKELLGFPATANIGWTQGRQAIDNRTMSLCEEQKKAGVTIYAITFGSGAGSSARSTFQNCATDPSTHYFHAPDATQLKTVFKAIGRSLAQLSIAS
ncbi:MAG: TadE/TadG family type IV pilus assembly protein [Pseudomonadota bacterium]